MAHELDLDDYRASVLPEDKAAYIQMLKDQGHTVIMVGDGINDTPALSTADVSISMQDSSDLARELADITLVSSNLNELVILENSQCTCLIGFMRIIVLSSHLIQV